MYLRTLPLAVRGKPATSWISSGPLKVITQLLHRGRLMSVPHSQNGRGMLPGPSVRRRHHRDLGAAAPARAASLAGLAPVYMEVGELDIFRDEDIEYARRTAAAGVSVELHVHPGCPHGFDRAAPGAAVVRRARAGRLRVLGSF